MSTPRTLLHRFDLAELETFVAVAELGSFSAAARRLNLGQPSVSQRIQRLEETLQTRLLVRTTRRVQTTPAGARLLAEATSALAALSMLLGTFREGGCNATTEN
jgi:DNA-binding transcriptional LysR family regulator